MPSNVACERCVADTKRRLDAMQVLCEMLTGLVRRECQKLEETKSAIAATDQRPQPSQWPQADSALDLLEG